MGANILERANRLERPSLIAILRHLKYIFSKFFFWLYKLRVLTMFCKKNISKFFFLSTIYMRPKIIFVKFIWFFCHSAYSQLTNSIYFSEGVLEKNFLFIWVLKRYTSIFNQSIKNKNKLFSFSLNRKHSQTIFRFFFFMIP